MNVTSSCGYNYVAYVVTYSDVLNRYEVSDYRYCTSEDEAHEEADRLRDKMFYEYFKLKVRTSVCPVSNFPSVLSYYS